MKRLCTICVRGGSKGVVNKNIRNIAGKPLLAYTIQQAQESGLFDAIAVSSDSEEILSVAKTYGVEYLVQRPIELAGDTSPKIPAIQHCVKEVERMTNCQFDTFVDLDATSPLRISKDIQEAVELFEQKEVTNLITAMPSRRSPYFNMVEIVNGRVQLVKDQGLSVERRQDAPLCYDMNASIYIWSRKGLFECEGLFHEDTVLYIMPEERSIDIDTETDFMLVEWLLRRRQ